MTAINQDFEMYKGDDARPVFTVLDAAGVAINISAASEIDCRFYDAAGVEKLVKLKSTAGIAFVGSGADGKFYIDITAANSALLDGWYFHNSRITDSTGKLSIHEMGRILVKDRTRGE